MDKFIERWKSDKRYQTKIKLALYTLFVVVVSIYALSVNNLNQNLNITEPTKIDDNKLGYAIKLPDNYTYNIDINIDDTLYKYYGENKNNEKTITKEYNTETTTYLYKNNEYYIKNEDTYIKTNKNEVYDIVNYNYINIESINTYLEKAEKQNNQYLIYLKDVILNNESTDYFVITINANIIDIDYTPLVKEFSKDINKYTVTIKYEEIE